MIVTAPQCALRDLRQPLRQPLPLAVLAAVALVLALSGPFGTLEALRPGPRLAYWAAVVALAWAAGHMGSAPLRHSLTGRSLATPAAPAAPVAGLRIRRSHWVALSQIRSATRGKDGGQVSLACGIALTISRARLPEAAAAGLFAMSR